MMMHPVHLIAQTYYHVMDKFLLLRQKLSVAMSAEQNELNNIYHVLVKYSLVRWGLNPSHDIHSCQNESFS